MTADRLFLDPSRTLVEETVDWLCGGGPYASRVERTPEGAHSLAHELVVVPTAQSARTLRCALARAAAARGWGALVPPVVAMANDLLVPDGVAVASEAEELAAMAMVLLEAPAGSFPALFPVPPAERTPDWALDTAGLILGVQGVLGEGALRMADVASAAEPERWRDLAALEALFFARLEKDGVVPRALARRRAVAEGCRAPGVREIVLPSAVDVQPAFVSYLERSPQRVAVLVHASPSDAGKFDAWGRPVAVFAAPVRADAVEASPTAALEAASIASHFRGVASDEALPALVVCDPDMGAELEGAFQNVFPAEELVLVDPARERLSRSSLGRLLGAILRLKETRDYDSFSTLARTGDIARWACGELRARPEEIASFTGALDAVQNAYLPRTLDAVVAAAGAKADAAHGEADRAAAAGLKRLAEAVSAALDDPFAFLRRVFASVVLDGSDPSSRELVAASEAVRDVRAACRRPAVPASLRLKVFSRLLEKATYKLEPLADNILVTAGWLELPWCAADELVIAGFNEGCVPENIVGHPFVPDALRKELGLPTNADREARDSFILAQALACRAPGRVNIRLHQISREKNVMKPSRILFAGVPDGELPGLALRLYAVTKGDEGCPAKERPPAWRLALPFPPPGVVFRERMSPTDLEKYRCCPFDFFLSEVFGKSRDDRNLELDALAFGNLCHDALDRFATGDAADSADADEIARFLADAVRERLSVFGADPPAVVRLQGEAAIQRLTAFASLQAARRAAGWRIVASEKLLSCRIKSCPTLLRGKVDRIDRHETTGELAIIDYKTWRDAEKRDDASVQLPLYRAMVEASGLFDLEAAARSHAFYCILGDRPEDVFFDEEHAFHAGGQSEAEDRIVGLLTDLAKGIFYVPHSAGSGMPWQKAYAGLIGGSPEEGVCEAWLADQKARREAAS